MKWCRFSHAHTKLKTDFAHKNSQKNDHNTITQTKKKISSENHLEVIRGKCFNTQAISLRNCLKAHPQKQKNINGKKQISKEYRKVTNFYSSTLSHEKCQTEVTASVHCLLLVTVCCQSETVHLIKKKMMFIFKPPVY